LLLKDTDGLADAIAQFRPAIALVPEMAEAHVSLGAVLFRVSGKSALTLKPNLEIARQMLKVANSGVEVKQADPATASELIQLGSSKEEL
jgi:hypothetical protein